MSHLHLILRGVMLSHFRDGQWLTFVPDIHNHFFQISIKELGNNRVTQTINPEKGAKVSILSSDATPPPVSSNDPLYLGDTPNISSLHGNEQVHLLNDASLYAGLAIFNGFRLESDQSPDTVAINYNITETGGVGGVTLGQAAYRTRMQSIAGIEGSAIVRIEGKSGTTRTRLFASAGVDFEIEISNNCDESDEACMNALDDFKYYYNIIEPNSRGKTIDLIPPSGLPPGMSGKTKCNKAIADLLDIPSGIASHFGI